jgi:hypothetical protein
MEQYEIALRKLAILDELKLDDYKIIKCYEAQLTNKPMPYDHIALIKKRDALRFELEGLEKIVKESK